MSAHDAAAHVWGIGWGGMFPPQPMLHVVLRAMIWFLTWRVARRLGTGVALAVVVLATVVWAVRRRAQAAGVASYGGSARSRRRGTGRRR